MSRGKEQIERENIRQVSFTSVKRTQLSSFGRLDAVQGGVGVVPGLLLVLVWEGRKGRRHDTETDIQIHHEDDDDDDDEDDDGFVVLYIMYI